MTQFLNIDKKKDKREENQPQNIESWGSIGKTKQEITNVRLSSTLLRR